MKQVFSNHAEVCHAFNLQNQERGRAGNIFFEEEVIYSYGYHYTLGEFIAHDTILINNKGYSVSTDKHISILKDATRNRKQILTREIVPSLVLSELEDLYKHLMKARKPENYFCHIRYIYNCFRSNKEYLNGVYLESTLTRGFHFISDQEIKGDLKKVINRIDEIHALANEYSKTEKYLKKVERAKELDAIKAEREREKREERAKEYERTKAERIQHFKDHKSSYVAGLAFDLLRLSKCGQYVKPSQAVRIPIKEAQRYFTLFQKGLDLRGHKIGDYTTLSNSLGLLKIGCHKITHDEVNRVGQLINA